MNSYKLNDTVNTRALIGDTLCKLADKNPDIWAVTSDCGGCIGNFAQKYADRYVDTGIAEQNAAGISAGLALSGAVPYIVGMATFVTMRAFEQNRSAIGYQNLNVRIVGYVAGMTTGGGSTHYAIEDVSLLRSIAGMSVISVSDPGLMMQALEYLADHKGPCYVRIGGNGTNTFIYDPETVKFQYGKGILAREGSELTIFAHGVMVKRAMAAADALKAQGVSVRVVDMFTIKPLDTELVIRCAKETGHILVWEDHYVQGGLATAIADALTDAGVTPKSFTRVGIPESYPGFGTDQQLYEKYGMDENSVVKKILETLR